MLQSLLQTTERVVQEIDSVEYGLTDIQVDSVMTSTLFFVLDRFIAAACLPFGASMMTHTAGHDLGD